MFDEKKQVLIAVKTFPNPSKTYGETVCCAGIDLKTGQWVRLFPIQYRDLDDNQKFRKYSVIEVNCGKPLRDKRPESNKVDRDSIKFIEWWDTKKDKWARRKSVILPTLSESMCRVYEKAKSNLISLALVKPKEIDFLWKKSNLKDQDARESCYSQLSFFDKQKNAPEQIPFSFYYKFKCQGVVACPGHQLKIIDWEIVQSYRRWRHMYKPQELLDKIKEKWLGNMCSEKKNTYFFVGNEWRFPQQFHVLGTFYPPK